MAKDRDQRTEKQTAKRKKESRKKGQVARSPTLVSWVTLLIATLIIPGVVSSVGAIVADGLRGIDQVAADPEPSMLIAQAGVLCRRSISAVAPLLVGAALVALVGNLAQVGLVFTTGPLKPKWERVNPAAGFKRLLSTKSLWEAGKQVVTMGVVVAVSIPAVRAVARSLLGSSWALGPSLAMLAASVLALVQLVAVIGCVIGVADYAWQRYNLLRDNKMTKQEVKQENRDSEGDPHMKAKLRANRMAMSGNRMLSSVADADVVITNPTHVAMALRYDPTKGAPRVLARGADETAARIRARAVQEGVPVLESPPLARALYRSCRVDDEIPPELFQAVATVLAFVRRTAQRAALLGSLRLAVPDTWTVPGEDPERSLSRDSRSVARATRGRRRAHGAASARAKRSGPSQRSPGRTLIAAASAPIDQRSGPRHDAGRVTAWMPGSSKGT